MDNSKIDLESCRNKLLTPRDMDRLRDIRMRIEGEWRRARPLYPYTPHDNSHCEKVEELLYKLIEPEKIKEKLTSEEIFLLLASIWLHDIGMKPHLFIDDPSEDDYRGISSTFDYDKTIRENHAERSERYVEENGNDLGLTEDEIRHIGAMCLLHRHRAYKELYKQDWETKLPPKIRIQLLIAYLRLADALHIPDKADTTEFKIYMSLGLDTTSRYHWFRSKYAKDIKIDEENHKITILLRIPEYHQDYWTKKLEPLKKALITGVQDELDSIKDILFKGGICVYTTIDCDAAPDKTLKEDDAQQLKELLNNIELFDPMWTPNASSVINTVLKQTQLFIRLKDANKSVKYLDDYTKNALKEIIEKRPCHIFLLRIYYLLIETLQNTGITNEEKIRIIKKEINGWSGRTNKVINDIYKHAYSILNKDLSPILLYGYSDTVVKCLELYLYKTKRNLEIFVCEGRTKTNYRYNNRLVYCDGVKYAEELKASEKRINDELYKSDNLKFLFCWDEVPGRDDDAILDSLKHDFGITWKKKPKIEKIDNDRTIKITTEEDSISLRLNDERTKVYLDTNKNRTDEFIVMDYDKPDVYKKANVKIWIVPDSCVSNLMSRDKVGKVLFGANGINQNGKVSHTLGHLAIADIASKYKIPVYVIADSMKIGDLKEKPELERGNQWLTTDIDFEPRTAEFKMYNPREDVIPPDRIKRIITEKGIFRPNEIQKYLRNNRYIMKNSSALLPPQA